LTLEIERRRPRSECGSENNSARATTLPPTMHVLAFLFLSSSQLQRSPSSRFTRNPVRGRSALHRMDLQPAPQMPLACRASAEASPTCCPNVDDSSMVANLRHHAADRVETGSSEQRRRLQHTAGWRLEPEGSRSRLICPCKNAASEISCSCTFSSANRFCSLLAIFALTSGSGIFAGCRDSLLMMTLRFCSCRRWAMAIASE
jgi:hypothetical protein